jgi:uncharacterized YccA/Bax inhibitor family protein
MMADMPNPLLTAEKLEIPASPPTAWPGQQPGAPIPPAPDNVPGSPWPPPAPVVEDRLRRGGVVTATAVLLAIMCATAVIGWQSVTTETVQVINDQGQQVEQVNASAPFWVWIASFVGLAFAFVAFFKPTLARIFAPLYAAAQGIFVGALSAIYDAQWDGIVLQAVGCTIGVFAVMLVLYATGVIRVTPRLRLGIIAATAGICLVYLVSFVWSLFGSGVPFIHDTGAIGIGFSLFVVGIAAMNLTLDFDFVDQAEAAGAPRHMEWFAALGLVVSLVWLYLEMLRLLAKLRSR